VEKLGSAVAAMPYVYTYLRLKKCISCKN